MLLDGVVEHDDSRAIFVTALKGDPAAIRRDRPLWLQSLCEEVTHVPLIAVIHDGPVGRCPHLAGPVQLAELFQSLHQQPATSSLVSAWRDAIAGMERLVLNSPLATAVRTRDWFAIHPQGKAADACESAVQLFPQPADRWLVLDQAGQYPELVEGLRAEGQR
jgi:hypothetical protein